MDVEYEEWISYEQYEPCCKMNKVLNINNELLPLVMKVMKYSMQPALFEEPLEDFLEVFGNLDFLGGFKNLTKIGGKVKTQLMDLNWNPRVFACQYAREPEEIIGRWNAIPKCCLLYTSPSPRDATLSRMPSSA